MIIINLYEGFVSEIRAFFLGYRLAKIHNDELVMDLSQFYQGSFWSYHMDLLNIPEVKKIAFRDTNLVESIERKYEKKIHVIRDGFELEKIHNLYDINTIYYIINDSYFYDDFFIKHEEFFFRYIGNDEITKELFSMIRLKSSSVDYKKVREKINLGKHISVGVHIRLGDFYNVGWIVEKDFDFYKAAIQWFRENESSPVFYVFSDDIDRAQIILGVGNDIEYVHFPFSYQSDIEELLCLASCDCRILDKKSTYGLFAETIAQNQCNKDGMTLIIKERHFQEDAGNKEYVEKATNTDEGINKRLYFGTYKELDLNSIINLSARYEYSKFVNINLENIPPKHQKEVGIVFATRQTYVKAVPHGLQYLSHYLAKNGYNTSFIGKREDGGEEKELALQYVIETANLEHGMNSLMSDVMLYSYKQLNEFGLYNAFYNEICKDLGCKKLFIIVRKPIALPPKNEQGDNIYVFIDFTDPYDVESKCCLNEYSVEEIDYLYNNADLIITFDKNTEEKQKNRGIKDIELISLDEVFPSSIESDFSIKTEQLRNGNETYCKKIMEIFVKYENYKFNCEKGEK